MANWPVVALREVSLKTSIIDPAKSPYQSFQYIDVSAVSSTLWKITDTKSIDGLRAPSRARKLVREGDVLFATVRPTLKRVALVPSDLDGQIASTGFCVLRADRSKVDPHFIYYTILTNEFIGRIAHLERGASYPAVSDGDVLGQSIALPSLIEQRQICLVLSKIQSAIEVQERVIALLNELKISTMAKLFHEGLRGESLRQSEIGEIPKSWRVVRLGDHCQITSGGTPSRVVADYWNGRIPWVKTGEIAYRPIRFTQEYITENGLKNSSAKIVPKGTLLMAMYGQGNTRGRVAFTEIEATTNQACAALFPDRSLNSGFLYAFCCLAYEKIRDLGHGANQAHLSGEILKSILLPLPADIQEQEDISRVVSLIDSKIEMGRHRRNLLKAIFSSILHLLMTGQVRVKNS